MYSPPPQMNLVVIRSRDIELAKDFYFCLGMLFSKEQHGDGPGHYAYSFDEFVFEIYPLREGQLPTSSVRLGFLIDEIDGYLDELVRLGGQVIEQPRNCSHGRKVVIRDPDGHTVELVCKNDTIQNTKVRSAGKPASPDAICAPLSLNR